MHNFTIFSCVQECDISAHRLVLAASSSYFYAMFTNKLHESTSKKVEFNFYVENIHHFPFNYIYYVNYILYYIILYYYIIIYIILICVIIKNGSNGE